MRRLLVMLTLAGCGDSDESTAVVPPSSHAAGLPSDMACPPAEWPRNGECIPAGVPPDGCAQGFVHDGDRGCTAILPEPCGPGLMAVPGEMRCRPVAPCAAGAWGDIPLENDTEFVDDSYSGIDSDGSALKPWTTVQAGVAAAAAGAIVAIAEGNYAEDVSVSGKAVRLWGVCPERVEIVGTGAELAALQIFAGASGSEVRGLALRGEATGLITSGSLDVVLERLWVHATAYRGIDVENAFGPTRVTMRDSLVEQSRDTGVFIAGSEVTVETSVVRDTQTDARGTFGRGLVAQQNPTTGARATLLLRASLVERTHDVGAFLEGSDATVEASVIRNTLPDAQGSRGRGVSAQQDPLTNGRALLSLRASLVEQSHQAGVFVGASDATLETTVVRDTAPQAGIHGMGMSVQAHPTNGAPSMVVVRQSLIERSHEVGMFVEGSTANIEATVVRDTEANFDGLRGRGVAAQADPATATFATLTIQSSLVERNREVGVFVAGADARLEASLVRDTQRDTLGTGGRGVQAQAYPPTGAPSTLALRASLVENNHEAGVALSSAFGTIEACLIRQTLASPGFGAGEGIMVVYDPSPASASITSTRIHESALAAIAAWGGHAAIRDSALTCQSFDLDGESFNGSAAKLEDLGGNLCGCPEPTAGCKAVSAGLVPPPPLVPLQD